ncbi:cytochrome P450 3A2-like [Pecten maximus]|uniref:cytochrome P450 3A2-like n=1 Tax=Pecten maximus TaxID=6579 RepID=UPI001457E8CC|nr:cytochrome P450 3A2-like [Pecten maximus]
MISPSLVVADKEMLREILVRQFANFPDRRTIEGFNGDMEHGILFRKGQQWKQNRSIISPTFSSGKLRQMVPLIQEACDTLLKTTRSAMKDRENSQVEMNRLFGGYTMDVISSTAFGIHVDSQSNPDDLFVVHVKKILAVTLVSPWTLLIMIMPALKKLLLKLGVCIFPEDSQAYFRKLTADLVKERMEGNPTSRKDFLQLVVEAQGSNSGLDGDDGSFCRGLGFEEILANSQLFFAAGYETTSTTLTMTAYNLATNQTCQDKLRKEIENIVGSGRIDYENIQELRYLDMCISETLRMYPSVMRVNRMCVKTTKIKNITIPAGVAVTLPIYALHHDPEVWEKPEVFNPERFSDSGRYDPLDFIPFGHGPRICIAMRLALLEAKMVIVDLVRTFRLCIGNKTNIPPKLEDASLLRPTHMWLRLEELNRTSTLA